jgi:hypothetical protein
MGILKYDNIRKDCFLNSEMLRQGKFPPSKSIVQLPSTFRIHGWWLTPRIFRIRKYKILNFFCNLRQVGLYCPGFHFQRSLRLKGDWIGKPPVTDRLCPSILEVFILPGLPYNWFWYQFSETQDVRGAPFFSANAKSVYLISHTILRNIIPTYTMKRLLSLLLFSLDFCSSCEVSLNQRC